MDPRHYSQDQDLLNELIDFINKFMRENVENVLANNVLRNDIKEISKNIYAYAQMWVDVDGVLSNKNCLSVDMVLFPAINGTLTPEMRFSQLIGNIESVVEPKQNDGTFYKSIQTIIVTRLLA